MIGYQSLFSGDVQCMQYSAIRRMAGLSSQPGIISFAAGAPNIETFPAREIREIASMVLERDGHNVLQYGPTLGFTGLLDAVVDFCNWKRIPRVHREKVAVCNGSQQALDLLGRLFIDPGNVVFLELPSYIGAISAFRNLQAKLVGVAQAEDGLVVEDLVSKIESAKRQGDRTKVLYIIPNFQNPSGVTLSTAKRQLLLEVAEKHNLLIIEDDPYGEIYFETEIQPRLAPVKSYDQHERVIYLSSFSKILAPGLRAGWILASPSVIEKIDLAKQAADLCGSMLDQRIVAECWKQGIILEHLPQIRAFYKCKAQVMLHSLECFMPSAVRWTYPEGGLFLWVTLPSHLNSETLLFECLEKEKVSYVIGEPFHVNGEGSHTLRLAFSKENEDNIALGIERLARVFKSHLG